VGTKAGGITVGPSPAGGRSSVRRLAIAAPEQCRRREIKAGGCQVRGDGGALGAGRGGVACTLSPRNPLIRKGRDGGFRTCAVTPSFLVIPTTCWGHCKCLGGRGSSVQIRPSRPLLQYEQGLALHCAGPFSLCARLFSARWRLEPSALISEPWLRHAFDGYLLHEHGIRPDPQATVAI